MHWQTKSSCAGRYNFLNKRAGTFAPTTKTMGSFLGDQALVQHTERPRWYCEIQHVTALVSLVEAGLGVGVVLQLAMPPDNHPVLESVPLLDPEVTRILG